MDPRDSERLPERSPGVAPADPGSLGIAIGSAVREAAALDAESEGPRRLHLAVFTGIGLAGAAAGALLCVLLATGSLGMKPCSSGVDFLGALLVLAPFILACLLAGILGFFGLFCLILFSWRA